MNSSNCFGIGGDWTVCKAKQSNATFYWYMPTTDDGHAAHVPAWFLCIVRRIIELRIQFTLHRRTWVEFNSVLRDSKWNALNWLCSMAKWKREKVMPNDSIAWSQRTNEIRFGIWFVIVWATSARNAINVSYIVQIIAEGFRDVHG